MEVFRPAIFPDKKSPLWYPFMICGGLAITGVFLSNLYLVAIPLIVMMVFPGIPIAVHTVYFLSVKITINGDRLTVVDWAGDPFVSYPRRQEIALSTVAYVYYLKKEAKAHISKTPPTAPFHNTRIILKKYRAALRRPRRAPALARTDNGLILSDKEGEHKVYLMHFHDLSKTDWQRLANLIWAANGDISFIMDESDKKGLLAHHTGNTGF